MEKKILSVLKSIQEVSKKQGNVYPISFEQGKFLNELIRSNKAKLCLELGVSHGFSTIFQAEALKETKGKLIAVESNPDKVDIAKSNIDKCGLSEQVILKIGSAQKAIKEFDAKLDLVFMDINKDQYIACFDLLLPKLKQHGIIVADNLLTHNKELAGYQDYVRSNPEITSFLVPIGNGFEVSIKR
jgi:predicted O-methyltransferase YrrM|tara:strand:- start:41 stop:598 length:558 start_codon:yes stop_codon:yes gene_type:complete